MTEKEINVSIPRFKRLSSAQQRDFDYYLKIASEIKAFQIIETTSSHISESLEEWFFLWDTHGIVSHYQDMQLCGRLTQAKDSINLTIALWVEDIEKETGNLRPDEVWEWCHSLPSWVWKSFTGKITKLGLPFKWQKIEYAPDGKTYWPAWFIQFDPCI